VHTSNQRGTEPASSFAAQVTLGADFSNTECASAALRLLATSSSLCTAPGRQLATLAKPRSQEGTIGRSLGGPIAVMDITEDELQDLYTWVRCD
jgi:hypothetical protein